MSNVFSNANSYPCDKTYCFVYRKWSCGQVCDIQCSGLWFLCCCWRTGWNLPIHSVTVSDLYPYYKLYNLYYYNFWDIILYWFLKKNNFKVPYFNLWNNSLFLVRHCSNNWIVNSPEYQLLSHCNSIPNFYLCSTHLQNKKL